MNSTQAYLSQVAPTRAYSAAADCSPLERVAQSVHDHPYLVQITRIILIALSLGALIGTLGGYHIAIGAIGLVGLITTEVVHRKLSFYGVFASPMASYRFKEAQCEGGRLFYQGNVPILTLQSDDPYIAGKAHGYLTASEILQLHDRVSKAGVMPKASEVQNTLDKIQRQLPPDYLKEMEGLIDGVSQWTKEQYWFSQYPELTLNEVLLLSLMPDTTYLNLRGGERDSAEPIPNVACTVTIAKDKAKGPIFGRNMDWPSFGLAGTYSLVINRKYTSGKPSTVEIGIPGIIGTLTGMNSHGLSVAMNVCFGGRSRPDGIPAMFYNRMLLESCKSVTDSSSFVKNNEPFGSYHLSVADHKTAQCFHFYQKRHSFWGGEHTIRELNGDKPLITTNGHYSDSEENPYYGCIRNQNLKAFFADAKSQIQPQQLDLEALVAHGLTLPHVNNVLTTHTVEMIPSEKRMRAAFDNSFSASQSLQEIDTSSLLKE